MSETTLFFNTTAITMSDPPVLADVDVKVYEGRIVDIVASNDNNLNDALAIDGTGKYLMPGLCDMHVHLFNKEDLLLYLPNGVTTVRVMSGEPAFNQWRDRINSGHEMGPRMYNFGPIMDGDPPVIRDGPQNITVRTPEEARREVLRLKAEGYDFIKIYLMLLPEVFSAIAKACAEESMEFGGHPPFAVGCREAALAGMHSIEHTAYVGLDDVELLAELGTWICPTLIIHRMTERVFAEGQALLQDNRLRYIRARTLSSWERTLESVDHWQDMLEQMNTSRRRWFTDWVAKSRDSFIKTVVRKAYQEGCRLILGTDAPFCFVYPAFSVHDELALLVDCGLTPEDSLKTGTRNAAECLGILAEAGTLEPGKIADLVLMEGNPLEDIKNTERIAGVMKDGRWYDRIALDEMLATVEQACKRANA